MASAPSEPRPVLGRLDKAGRLIAADPELDALQRESGAELGQALALPQIAAIADLARELRIEVARPAIAAAADHDVELWVRATPEGDEVALSLEGWTRHPASGPRLGPLLGAGSESPSGASYEWTADEELRLISIAVDLAALIDVDPEQAAGSPLTRIVRLEENAAGEMPLISALASRRAFSGQRARSRSGEGPTILLSGEVVTGADGSFAGFRGTAEPETAAKSDSAPGGRSMLDQTLDELLRSPLNRIIESAERIVDRADGPLRSNYTGYGNDIAAAARHLLAIVRGMGEEAVPTREAIDLAALTAEAVVMLDAPAEEGKVSIQLESSSEPLRATGQERAVIQILVNLIGNAIRYSPEGAMVQVSFGRTGGTASVTVADEGPGIAAVDQQRIFERFERAHGHQEGTGLGLAISRRLARSMGGDVTVDSVVGQGARFTLTLPRPSDPQP